MSNCIKIVNFWLQLFSIWWDGKYFNGRNFYLDILQIQENRAGRISQWTCMCIYCSLRKQKSRLKTTTTNGWQHFGQSEQRKSSALFPIQSERSPDSGFFACDLWKYCIMPSSQKQITELKEKGMITGFPLKCLDYQSTDSTCACIYVPKIWIANKLPNCILQIVSILHTSNNTYYVLFKAHFLFVTRFLFFSKWTCSIYILMEAYTTTLEYPATCHNALKNDEV